MISFLRPLLPLFCAVLPICPGWAEQETPQPPGAANLTGGNMGVQLRPPRENGLHILAEG